MYLQAVQKPSVSAPLAPIAIHLQAAQKRRVSAAHAIMSQSTHWVHKNPAFRHLTLFS